MQTPQTDFVSIRGRHLNLNELLSEKLSDDNYLAGLKARVQNAHPFPHLVEDNWFNPRLLELVAEEFDLYRQQGHSNWKTVQTSHELTFRSVSETKFGPATQLYFDLINSGWFVRRLSYITGVEDLVVDPQFYGGGLHETKQGGHFGIHRDFDRHLRTGLRNEMVLLTYLNKDWAPEWNGGLELWDKQKKQCEAIVEPLFGRTAILLHGPHSHHGHPKPMCAPEGITRRSVAAYYYTNKYAEIDRKHRQTSNFATRKESKKEILRRVIQPLTPPVIWRWMARVLDL